MEDTCILIVDDDAGIRDTMHEFIGMSGYDAMSAASAEEALEILKTMSSFRISPCREWMALN